MTAIKNFIKLLTHRYGYQGMHIYQPSGEMILFYETILKISKEKKTGSGWTYEYSSRKNNKKIALLAMETLHILSDLPTKFRSDLDIFKAYLQGKIEHSKMNKTQLCLYGIQNLILKKCI